MMREGEWGRGWIRKRGDVNREGVLSLGGKGVNWLGVRKKVV